MKTNNSKKALFAVVCLAVLIGMISLIGKLIGTASAVEGDSTLDDAAVRGSATVVRDGSVAYGSVWTSRAVEEWNATSKLYMVDPATGEVRYVQERMSGIDNNGGVYARHAFGNEFMYRLGFVYNVKYSQQSYGNNMNEVWKWDLPEVIPTPTPAPSAAPTATPVITATPTPTPLVYPASNIITWAIPFDIYSPNEQQQLKINRLLYEKGLDCAVSFVPMGVLVNRQNEEWLLKKKEAGAVPDILCSGLWIDDDREDGTDESNCYEFVKKYFVPLQEMFDTEDGKKLKGSFSDNAWNCSAANGQIYVLPLWQSRSYGYVLVNNQYLSRFKDFDGSYKALREIYDSIGNSDLKIVINRLDQMTVGMTLGYSSFGQLVYDDNTHQILPFAGFTDAVKGWSDLYHDSMDGIVRARMLQEIDESTVLAEYVVTGKETREGYTPIRLDHVRFSPRFSMSFGIYADSEQKELAMKVMAACMGDPEITSLLRQRLYTAEMIEEQRKVLDEEPTYELDGFMPSLTTEQWNLFKKISDRMSWGAYIMLKEGEWEQLKEGFNAAQLFGELSGDDVKALIDELNRQIKEFLAGGGGQS